eukprot:3386885-Rhodomonas_salina.1
MLKDICPTVVLRCDAHARARALLRSCCNCCNATAAPHDSYYRDGPEVDRDCGGNWDCPDALNTHELVADLQKLKRGDLAEIPIYSFAANARVQDQSIPRQIEAGTKGVLLVEGLMVLHDEALRREMDVRCESSERARGQGSRVMMFSCERVDDTSFGSCVQIVGGSGVEGSESA